MHANRVSGIGGRALAHLPVNVLESALRGDEFSSSSGSGNSIICKGGGGEEGRGGCESGDDKGRGEAAHSALEGGNRQLESRDLQAEKTSSSNDDDESVEGHRVSVC